MSFASDEQQINDDLTTTSSWLLIAFFLGWAALILRFLMLSHSATIGLSTMYPAAYASLAYQTATSFVWSLAWLSGGFLFGFIFGIPKVIAATTSATNPALNDPYQNASPKLKVNTNLEDISDWLTKVLVGATLTQIVRVPSAISRAAEFMSYNDATKPFSFNAALLVYYSALGFLSGYILTRMFFARAFALADQGPKLSPEASKALDDTDVGFGRSKSAIASDPLLRKAALASDAVPITDSLSADQALRIAKGATLTGDVERALTASRMAVQKSPDDPQAQLTYAWSLHKLGVGSDVVLPIVEAAAQKLSSSSDPAILSTVYASLSYLWLYQPMPSSFEHALSVLDDYDKKGGPIDTSIEINRACAFGQKFAYLNEPPANSSDTAPPQKMLDDARNGALTAIRKAINHDPTSVSRLKELLWGSADPQDNDLFAFQDDPEFAALLPRS